MISRPYNSMMNTQLCIQVNGTEQKVQKGTTVFVLTQILALADRKVAIELNQAIVPRALYQQTQLCDGDCVEIIEAVGGG